MSRGDFDGLGLIFDFRLVAHPVQHLHHPRLQAIVGLGKRRGQRLDSGLSNLADDFRHRLSDLIFLRHQQGHEQRHRRPADLDQRIIGALPDIADFIRQRIDQWPHGAGFFELTQHFSRILAVEPVAIFKIQEHRVSSRRIGILRTNPKALCDPSPAFFNDANRGTVPYLEALQLLKRLVIHVQHDRLTVIGQQFNFDLFCLRVHRDDSFRNEIESVLLRAALRTDLNKLWRSFIRHDDISFYIKIKITASRSIRDSPTHPLPFPAPSYSHLRAAEARDR